MVHVAVVSRDVLTSLLGLDRSVLRYVVLDLF